MKDTKSYSPLQPGVKAEVSFVALPDRFRAPAASVRENL
jgi:hypothetical protein